MNQRCGHVLMMMPPKNKRAWILGWCAVFIGVLGLVPERSMAQGSGGGSAGGHAWAVIEDVRVDDAAKDSARWVVMHLPPAAVGNGAAGIGVVRAAGRLQKQPERLAWRDTRLFFVMPSETIITEGRRRLRRVYSTTAERSIAGAWMYLPMEGPGIEASLPGEGTLAGFVGAGAGGGGGGVPDSGRTTTDLGDAPAALIHLGTEADAASPLGGAWRLMVLGGREWIDVPLPWQGEGASASPPADARQVTLLGTPTGLGVLVSTGASETGLATGTWWTCRMTSVRKTGTKGVESRAVWQREMLALGQAAEAVRRGNTTSVEGRPLAVSVDDAGEMKAWLLLADGPVEVVSKSGVGSGQQVMPRDSSPGVVSVLWAEAGAEMPSGTEDAKSHVKAKRLPPKFGLFEFFASGRVLYDGPAKQDGPLSRREVSIIAALLGGVLMAVMVFVLKPEKPAPERLLKSLPKGTLPAGMGRRLIASVIDLLAGVVIAKSLLGLEWGRLTELLFVGSTREWAAMAGLTLAGAWLLPSTGEWLFGRSLGKWAVDCRVVSLRARKPTAAAGGEESARVELWQALVRNALKWVPPLSLTVLLGPRTRHFADQVAGTIVIEQEPAPIENGE